LQNGCQTDAVIDNPVGNLDEFSHQEDKRKKRYINRKRSNKFFQDVSIYDGGDLHLYYSLTLPGGGGVKSGHVAQQGLPVKTCYRMMNRVVLKPHLAKGGQQLGFGNHMAVHKRFAGRLYNFRPEF
jgi:hypothetical protein